MRHAARHKIIPAYTDRAKLRNRSAATRRLRNSDAAEHCRPQDNVCLYGQSKIAESGSGDTPH